MDKTIPNGVIIEPKLTDYVSGDGNLGALADRNLTLDWTPYTPKGERQSGNGFESNDCTGFGYTNVIEVQFKYFKSKGLISVEALKWLTDNEYLDENGDLNASDRALGSMAGTNSGGNSLNKVADTARLGGLIPEKKWPSVFTTYAEYYKPVPPELLALGQKFKTFFDLLYEQTFSADVKAAPLYVALCTCGGWNNPEPPPVAWCNAGNATNHAVCLLKANSYRIFDSYSPFVKDFAADYVIPYFYKVLLIIKNMNQTKVVLSKDGTTVYECKPIATDWPNFLKQASVEGIEVPDPIPPSSSL